MKTETTDKALAEILNAINTQFPELAGKGMDSMVEFVKLDNLVGISLFAFLFAVFFAMFALFLARYFFWDEDTDGLLACGFFFVSTLVLCFLCSLLPPYFSPEGYIISKILTGDK